MGRPKTDSTKQENDLLPADAEDHHISPYPVSRMAPSFDLVDLAKEIAKADDMLSIQTNGKLRILADQIRALQEEAQKILQEARQSQELHRAECNFQKKAGKIYYLYEKFTGELVFSMLSPEDWGSALPHKYKGSFKLENDMSWHQVDG